MLTAVCVAGRLARRRSHLGGCILGRHGARAGQALGKELGAGRLRHGAVDAAANGEQGGRRGRWEGDAPASGAARRKRGGGRRRRTMCADQTQFRVGNAFVLEQGAQPASAGRLQANFAPCAPSTAGSSGSGTLCAAHHSLCAVPAANGAGGFGTLSHLLQGQERLHGGIWGTWRHRCPRAGFAKGQGARAIARCPPAAPRWGRPFKRRFHPPLCTVLSPPPPSPSTHRPSVRSPLPPHPTSGHTMADGEPIFRVADLIDKHMGAFDSPAHINSKIRVLDPGLM